MKGQIRRILSLVLAIVMVLSIVPVSAEDSSVVVDETNTVETNPAAQIGETTYSTLAEAFEAAQTGQTIKLLRDVDEVVRLSVSTGTEVKSITLNLNGKTWDCGYGTRINAVDLKVTNGTIGTKRSVALEAGDSIDVFYFGGHGMLPSKMDLKGVTFNAELRVNNMAPSEEELELLATTKSVGKAFNATEVTIWDSQYDVVTVQKAAYLTINGGWFSGINAEDGAFVTDNRNKGESSDDSETTEDTTEVAEVKLVTILSTTGTRTERGVTVTFVDSTPVETSEYMQFTLGESSTVFTVQRLDGETWTTVSPESGTSTIKQPFTEPGTVTFRVDWDGNGTYDRLVVLVKAPVAKVGDKYYTSIDEAVAAWTDGTTLTILTDATVNLGSPLALLSDEITLKDSITAADGNSALVIESGNVVLNVNSDITLTGGKGGAGIYVAEGASLTIKGSGTLTAIGNGGVDTADSGAAGIGGTYANGNSGAITIDGATVVAKGYGKHGSGIGSGSGKVVGEIKIINGANVTAYGGYYADGAGTLLQSSYGKSDPEGGAAIGGGGKTASTIANITITDSTVVAYGGSKAAGIGANFWSNCGTITIEGNSNVTAQGGSSSAGIGTSRAGDTGVTANIVISGGTVTATGGAYGAGIGGGYNADSLGNGADVSALPEISVTISGGTVTANGGEGGAGVGGGYKTDNIDIDITGGTVTAQAGALVSGKTIDNGGEACAIGSGANGSGVFENSPAVVIGDDATVTATTEYGGKVAIEGDTDVNWDALDNVTVIINGLTIYGVITGAEGDDLVWSEEDGDIVGPVTIAGDVTITVIGKVPVVGTIRLSPDAIVDVKFVSGGEYNGNSATLIRGENFTGQMFYAEGVSGDFQNLTFEGITLDGGAVWTGDVDATLNRGTTNEGVKATGSVLYLVRANADLNGSTLQNHDDSTGEKANAVFLRYYSTIDFNNSVVRNNNSESTYYRGGVVTIRQGGTVTTNGANVYGNSAPSGGFVGISSTGSYGGVVKAYDSKFHNNYADNGAVFLMQCNSNRGYLEIDGCEFYNNASKTAVLTEWAYSRPFIISNSTFHDNECAVWDCHADPVLNLSGKIVVTEDADYTKYLFETPLALGGALADGSSISISEATMKQLMGKGFVVTGTADYAVTEADLAKFVIPAGYKFWKMDYNSDGINDYALIVDTDAGVNVTVYDNFPGSEANETQLLPTTDESLPALNFTHEGADFLGWMTAADGTEVIAPQKFTEEATLYAKWVVNVAKVGDTKYETLAEAVTAANAIEGGATVELLADVTLGEKLTISGNVTISGEYTITRDDAYTGTLFAVSAGAALTLDGGLTIDGGNNYAFNSELYAADLADWENPTASADSAKWFTPEEGAPVATGYMITTSGTVNLNDVSIKNHYSTNGSGIVSASKGAKVTLDGAQITHNASTSGSGLVVNASAGVWSREEELITVTMNAGTVIDGNHVGGNHGIFKIYMGTYFTMNGGEVKNTTGWNSNGTVVGIYHGVFTMNGGTICSNSSEYGPNNGRNAAIYGHSNHLFTMNGGTICHNTGRSKAGIDSPYSETGYTGLTVINGGTVVDNTILGTWTTPDVSGGATMTITGGIYSQDVSQWVAPGYACVLCEEGENAGYYEITDHIFDLYFRDPTTGEQVPGVGPLQGNDLASIIATGKLFYADYYDMELVVLHNTKIDEGAVIDYPMVVNLNGKTLTGVDDVYPMIRVQGGANVTVKNGTMTNSDYVFVLGASDGSSAGNLTIESGSYTGETTVASVTKGKLTVVGGEFKVTNDATYLLNCIDANYKDGSAKIVVTGGTFYGFNPENNAAEGEGTNFCATDYVADEIEENVWLVRLTLDILPAVVTITFTDSNSGETVTLEYPSERYDTIQKLIGTNDYADFVLGAEQSELLAYVANGTASNIVMTLHDDVALDAPINFYNKYFQMDAKYDITLDGNGHTITWADGYTGTLLNVESGVSLTTKNVTIDGENAFTFYDDTTTVENGQNWYTRFVNVGEEDKAVNANVIVNAGNLTLGEGTKIQNVTIASDNNKGNGKTENTETGYVLKYNDDLAVIYSTGGTVSLNGATISGNAGMILNADNTTTTLNGATINGNMGCGRNGGVIDLAGGTMTISNSSINGNKAMARCATIIGVTTNAVVTMNSGSIDNNKQIGVGGNTAGSMIVVREGSKFIMNGGSISNNAGGRAGAIASRFATADANIILNAGTITGNTASNDSWNGASIFLRSPAEIHDGMNIDGAIVVNASPAVLTIDGGTVYGSMSVADGLTASITGGTFNYDPTEWVAEGYEAIDNGDGTWTVQEKIYAIVEVEIMSGVWGKSEIKLENWADLEAALGENTNLPVKVTIMSDLELEKALTISGTKTVELNLNGKIITSAEDAIVVEGGVSLTINGEGEVKGGTSGVGSWTAVWANGGDVIINGGTYSVGGDKNATDKTHQNDVIYTKNGGTVTINGGTFLNDGNVWTLNENDANRETITVYGGTFHNWNPEDNVSEGEGTNFCAPGYVATANADETVWTVAEWNGEIWNKEDLYRFSKMAQAFAANDEDPFAGKTVKLMADVDAEWADWYPINFYGTFEGNNHTISNLTYIPRDDGRMGFFQLAAGPVSDLTLDGIKGTVPAGGRFGGFARYLNAVATNVHIKNIEVTTTDTKAWVGGFTTYTAGGRTVDCTVENLFVDASAGADLIAGFAALTSNRQVYSNSDVKGFKVIVTDTDSSGCGVGGWAGQTQTGWNNPKFENCDVTGIDITATGLVDVGGFIAWPGAHTEYANNCTTQGKIDVTGVTSSGCFAGGFFGNLGWNCDLGYMGHVVNNCSANVDITTKVASAGGFVGSATNSNNRSMYATFNSCSASGNITAVAGGTANIGGFAGEADRGVYNNCSANGTVTNNGTGVDGGFIGEILDTNPKYDGRYPAGTRDYLVNEITFDNSKAACEPFVGFVTETRLADDLTNVNSYVAKVGDSLYATFDAALAAAKASEEKTVEILAPVVLTTDKDYDLADVTVTNNGDVYPLFRIQNDANVTFKGGNVSNSDYVFVLGASDGSSAGNLTINGGTYTGVTTVASVTKGTLTITGGEFKVADGEYGATYLLNCIDANYKDGSAKIVVTGGTYYGFNPEANAAEGAETNFVAEGYIAEQIEGTENDWLVRKANYIAQVGDVKYESLQEAINACTAGETVKLIANVIYTSDDVVYAHGGGTGFGKYDASNPSIIYTGGTNVDGVISPSTVNAVLDLNGHTITNNADAYMFMIMDNAKLTFKDSVGTGSITNNAAAPVIWAVGTETLVKIESGKYVTANNEGLLWSTHGADMVIDGGNFSTTADDASMLIVRSEKDRNNAAHFVDGNATITIYGGTYNYNPEKTYDDSTKPYTEFNAVADGYIARQTDVNTWVVGAGEWVAQVGEKLYEDFFTALEDAKVAEDKTVILLKSIELTEDKEIDLDGVTVKVDENLSAKPAFRVLANVTVKNGTVDATDGTSTYAFIVGNSATAGTLTIADGTYKGDVSAISITNGTANISGGTFEATEYNGAHEFTLNCIDSAYNNGTAVYNITGGKFYKFNPENNAAEGANTNFLAEKYTAVQNGDYYEVMDYVTWVKAELLAGNDVTLDRDVKITDYSYVNALKLPSNGNGKYTEVHGNGAVFHVIKPGVVFDLNGHTLTWDAHDDAYCNKRQVSLFMVTITGNAGETSSLTVVDSVGNGNVNVYGMGTAVYVVGVGAKADITGGTWTNYPCSSSACGASNIFMYPSHGGTLAISGGIFQQKESEYLIGWKGSTKETANNGVGTDFDETLVSITGGTFVNFNPETETKFFDVANSGQKTINGVAEGYIAKLVDGTENNWVVVKGEWVAQIGDVKYASVQEAVDAAQTGETVKLIADVAITETINVADDDEIVLDLNGHKLTNVIPADATVFHTIKNSGKLTVIDSVGGGEIQSNSAKGYVIYTEGGSLVVDGAKITGINNGYAIVTWTAGDSVTIEEGTVIEGRGALYVDGGATGTVNGGTFTMTVQTTNNQDNVVYVGGTSELTINGGTFSTGDITGAQRIAIAALGTSKVTINDGKFCGLTGDIQSRTSTGNVVVNGGTFTGTKLDERTADSIALKGGTYSYDPAEWVAEGYKAVDNGNGTWTVKPLVTVTFDDQTMVYGNELPEFTYTTNFSEVSEDGTALVVENPVVDVTGVGEYEITANAYVFMSDAYAVEVIPGKLTVQEANVEMDGIYYHTIKDALGTLRSADTTTHTVKVLKDHEIDVNYSTYNYPILVNGFSVELDMNGKTITADWSKYTGSRKDNALIGVCNGGKLDVIDSAGGGKIVNNDNKADVENRIFWIMTSTADKSIVVNIKGGSFIQNETNTALLYVQGNKPADNLAPMYVTISGGYFDTVNEDFFNAYDGFEHESYITGGSFNKNPTDWEIKIHEDYEAKLLDDGRWHVVPKEVASIGDTTYPSIQKAVDAAQPGDTITVLVDVTEANITVADDDNIVLDLNGKTLTGNIVNNGTLTVQNGSIDNNDADVSAIQSNKGVLTVTDVNVESARHAIRVEGGEATINDGTYKVSGTAKKTTHAVNVSGAGTKVTINGGTFVGPKGTASDSGSAINVQAGSTVNVTAGNFSGGKLDTLASEGTLSLTGGTYDQDPAAYVAEKYAAVLLTDGEYAGWFQVVAQTPVTVTINDVEMIVGHEIPTDKFGYTVDVEGAPVTVKDYVVLDVDGNAITTTGKELPAGTYTITATVEAEAPYVVTTENGTLTVKLFDLVGVNVAAQDSLKMYFYVNKADLNGEGYYAVVTKKFADGRDDVVSTIDFANWDSAGKNVRFGFSDISAKEMSDLIYVTVYNTDGVAVSNEYVDSIRLYANRMIAKNSGLLRIALVDMLNYGAAAQTYFKYDTGNLANADIADYQQYATASVTYEDHRVAGENYVGSTVSAKDRLLLTFVFKNITTDMTATVTYTDHNGNNETLTVSGSNFIKQGNLYGVAVTGLAVADGRQLVTCEVKDADGNVVASAQDSIESYCARQSSLAPVFANLMKFVQSAYNYFESIK